MFYRLADRCQPLLQTNKQTNKQKNMLFFSVLCTENRSLIDCQVGPRSCGKTSLVHLLAQLTGNRLEVMAMNSAMDTTELLGGFEQVWCFTEQITKLRSSVWLVSEKER